jgi:hypothetical protein
MDGDAQPSMALAHRLFLKDRPKVRNKCVQYKERLLLPGCSTTGRSTLSFWAKNSFGDTENTVNRSERFLGGEPLL